MTWVDGAVLAVLAVSALLAYSRGMVAEVLGVGAWVGAVALGLAMEPGLRPLVEPHVQPAWLATGVSVGAVFLVTLIVLKLLIAWVSGHVRRSALGGVDKALGLVFGLARGALVVVLAYIVGGLVLPAVDRWPDPVREARSLPAAAGGASWLVARLPADFRPRLPETAGQDPTLEQWLRPPARSRT